MGVNDEPTGDETPGVELENTSELFPVGVKLSELVAEFPRQETSMRLAEIIVDAGELTTDFYRETSGFIEMIKAATRTDWENAIDDDEKHALHNRRQILHQIGLVVLLLDVYWQLVDNDHEDLAAVLGEEINLRRNELLEELVMLLKPKQNAPKLINEDYFESIRQKLKGLIVTE